MADEKEVKAKPAKAAKAPKKSEAAERPTGKVAALPEGYAPRLRKHYDEVVRPKLIELFGYKNVMAAGASCSIRRTRAGAWRAATPDRSSPTAHRPQIGRAHV